MDLRMYFLDKSEKLDLDNSKLSLIEFRNLLLQGVKELVSRINAVLRRRGVAPKKEENNNKIISGDITVELLKYRVYKNDKSKAQKHRILLAQELLDVIQICITGLIMLTKDGIDIKLQLWKHNYKLIKERKWKANKYIEMRVRENVDKND
mgnify:CR=1 FL=1